MIICCASRSLYSSFRPERDHVFISFALQSIARGQAVWSNLLYACLAYPLLSSHQTLMILPWRCFHVKAAFVKLWLWPLKNRVIAAVV